MTELRTDYRPPRATNGSRKGDATWSPWAIFGVVVAAIVSGTIVLWILGAISIGAMLGGFAAKLDKQQPPRQPARAERPVTQRVVTVPSKSVEECKKETGGLINEHFARCRSGYQYVETTTR